MCIIGCILTPSGHLTLLHMRDEDYSRPAHAPRPGPGLICGIDERRGGTWMGWNPLTGLVAAVTNVRTTLVQATKDSSRGHMVLDFLNGVVPWARVEEAAERGTPLELGHCYSPFNLVLAHYPLGNPSAADDGTNSSSGSGSSNSPRVYHVSNVQGVGRDGGGGASGWVGTGPQGSQARVIPLGCGVHVLSNGPTTNDASWPKVKWVKEALERVLQESSSSSSTQGCSPITLELCTAPFTSCREPLPDAAPDRDLSWSPRPHSVEAALERYVVVPVGNPIENYGSRTLTAFLAAGVGGGGGGGGSPCTFSWHELNGEKQEGEEGGVVVGGGEGSDGKAAGIKHSTIRGTELWHTIEG